MDNFWLVFIAACIAVLVSVVALIMAFTAWRRERDWHGEADHWREQYMQLSADAAVIRRELSAMIEYLTGTGSIAVQEVEPEVVAPESMTDTGKLRQLLSDEQTQAAPWYPQPAAFPFPQTPDPQPPAWYAETPAAGTPVPIPEPASTFDQRYAPVYTLHTGENETVPEPEAKPAPKPKVVAKAVPKKKVTPAPAASTGKLTDKDLKVAASMRDAGMSWKRIADTFDVSETTIRRGVARYLGTE